MKPKIFDSYESCTSEDIEHVITELGCNLPKDYVFFIKTHNGGLPRPDSVTLKDTQLVVTRFYHFGTRYESGHLMDVYEVLWNTIFALRRSPYPDFDTSQYIAIAGDPGGNHFLLRVANPEDSEVAYWQRDEGKLTSLNMNFQQFLQSFSYFNGEINDHIINTCTPSELKIILEQEKIPLLDSYGQTIKQRAEWYRRTDLMQVLETMEM